MDPEVMAFLNRISRTIGFTLLWMGLNSTLGIMLGYAFVEASWQWYNYLYYFFLLLSSAGYFFLLYKIWKDPIDFSH
jgi:hypothetical protein